jgi:hypothetical protein
MQFVCPNNHLLDLSAKNFKRSTDCKHCPKKYSIKAKKEFIENIERLGGKVIGEYVNNHTSIECLCSKNHKCTPTPTSIQKGCGMCLKCVNQCSVETKNNFIENIEKLGGKVIGKYINNTTPVECLCIKKHICFPQPIHIRRGQGMCIICAGMCSIEAKKNFIENIEKLGGKVIGEYINNRTQVECLCIEGHTCFPTPSSVQRGRGICLKCVGLCPVESENNFREAIKNMEGKIIGEYINSHTQVECLCIDGHICYPTPNHIRQGGGMCIKCTDQCPIKAKNNFTENIEKFGGTVIGEYINSTTSVECLCSKNHKCTPTPTKIQQGYGMCKICINYGYSKIALEWLSVFETYIPIQHAENGGEHKIKLNEPTLYWKKRIAIDGYCADKNICFEFDGCLFHGCDNENCKFFNMKINPITGKSMEDMLAKTKAKHKLIEDLGYKLIVIKGCEYHDIKTYGNIDLYVQDILSNINLNKLIAF